MQTWAKGIRGTVTLHHSNALVGVVSLAVSETRLHPEVECVANPFLLFYLWSGLPILSCQSYEKCPQIALGPPLRALNLKRILLFELSSKSEYFDFKKGSQMCAVTDHMTYTSRDILSAHTSRTSMLRAISNSVIISG